jgi:pimeloyl-ACP methyl ester carboxylesterase
MARIRLAQGEIEYSDEGQGPAVVFVHGALVDGALWRGVARALGSGVRAIVPDWPMGSHRLPMAANADLGPVGMADIVADALEALDVRDVTLVGNDTGGAVCQILCSRRPERVGRLVLTNCDALERFPPPQFQSLPRLFRVPGLPWLAAKLLYHVPGARRFGFRGLTATPIADAQLRAWVEPGALSSAIRRDLGKLILGLSPRLTLDAAEALRRFDRPVLLAWGTRDPFFPLSLAERLAAMIPTARLERIEGARAFVPLDQPERVASLIRAFVAPSLPLRVHA